MKILEWIRIAKISDLFNTTSYNMIVNVSVILIRTIK